MENKPWTTEELDILQELAPNQSYKVIAKKLNRTPISVKLKLESLALSLGNKYSWSKEEDFQLLEKAPTSTLEELIALFPNKSTKAILERIEILDCNYLGQKKTKEDYFKKTWTDEEEKQLIELSKKYTLDELVIMFPKRTKYALEHKLQYLVNKRFTVLPELTNKEIKIIKENYNTHTNKELGIMLKVTSAIVSKYAKKLGLNRVKVSTWTNDKIDELKRLALTHTARDLAEYYETTESSMRKTLSKYNIKALSTDVEWTDDLVKQLIKLNNQGKSVHEIENIIGIKSTSISIKLRSLNLQKNDSYRWSSDEIQKLKDEYDKVKDSYTGSRYDFLCYLHTKLTKKPINTIENKLSGLKLPLVGTSVNLSKDDIERIKVLCNEQTVEELMHTFKCTSNQLKRYLNNSYSSKSRPWTDSDDQELLKVIDSYSVYDIAKMMNRSVTAIQERSKLLRVESAKYSKWKKEELELLSNQWGSTSVESIAEQLNRPTATIIDRARIMKLGSYKDNNESGIVIKDIESLFRVSDDTIRTIWSNLGLSIMKREISKVSYYYYVDFGELLTFLYNNQDIWDASRIGEDYFDDLPDWVKTKAKKDKEIKPAIAVTLKRKLRRK